MHQDQSRGLRHAGEGGGEKDSEETSQEARLLQLAVLSNTTQPFLRKKTGFLSSIVSVKLFCKDKFLTYLFACSEERADCESGQGEVPQ